MSVLDTLVQSLIKTSYIKENEPQTSKEPETKHKKTQPIPSWMRPIFAITIREERYAALQQRLGPLWRTYVVKWNGTVGTKIDRKNWLLKQKIRKYCQLTPGQLGCYDSHVSVWRNCVRSGSNTFVVEDDIDLRPDDTTTINTLNKFWTRLQESQLDFEFLYIGHNNKYKPQKYMTSYVDAPNIVIPHGCQGLFAYIITPKGAQFLLDRCRPYEKPLDVFVQHQLEYYNTNNAFRCYAMYPSPFYVVDVKSDTT